MATGKSNYPVGNGTVTSDATAVISDVISPKTFYSTAGTKLTGTITEKVGSNTVLTPSTSDQAFPAGRYGGATTDGKVSGSANLTAANIKSGVSLFGLTGTFPNNGTATDGLVSSGYTYYSSDATKHTGTLNLTPSTLSSVADGANTIYYFKHDKLYFGFYIKPGSGFSIIEYDSTTYNRIATLLGITINTTFPYSNSSSPLAYYYTGSSWTNGNTTSLLSAILAN